MRLVVVLAGALTVLVLLLPVEARSEDPPPPVQTTTVYLERTVEGRGVQWWAKRAKSNGRTMRARGRTIRRLKRTLREDGSVFEAIALASHVYGVSGALLRSLAWCESRYVPWARNPSGASGLMQFMPSTFASTPYRRFSLWSPYASAFAAGWMIRQGRLREWECAA